MSPVRIILAVLSFMLIGMFWYSPMALGQVWAETKAYSTEIFQPSAWHYAGAVAVALVMALGLSQLLAWVRPGSFVQALKVGIVSWLAFIATSHFSAVIWAAMPLTIYLIDVGCLLLNVLVMSAILYQPRR